MTTPCDQNQFLLGEIHAKVQSIHELQSKQSERLDSIDERLRAVEQRSAIAGAISGGVMGIGVALIAESLKQWIGHHGGTGGT